MKQYKTTIISLIVIVIVVAGFFIISAVLDRNKTEDDPAAGTAEEAKSEKVFNIESVGAISRYECKSSIISNWNATVPMTGSVQHTRI